MADIDPRFARVTLADGTEFQVLSEVEVGVDERGAPVLETVWDEAATAAAVEAHLAAKAAPAPAPAKK